MGLTVFGFFQRGFSAIGDFVSNTFSSIAELRKLRDNYRELSAKLERFTNMERGLADLREENKRLKEQLGFAQDIPYQRIAARIVAKDPENLYSTITIDKGIGDGIRKNMPVIAFQDGMEGLVGRVVEVGRGNQQDRAPLRRERLRRSAVRGQQPDRGLGRRPGIAGRPPSSCDSSRSAPRTSCSSAIPS